jgi:NitT/TauT family transport system substrate-binding protein
MADVKTVNTSDADIVAAYGAADTKALVTWNPQLSEVKKAPGATEVFDSSKIPGEILDGLMVSTDALKANPNLGKALTGIWYETLALTVAQTPEGKAAREAMAKLSGSDLASFESQLKTTYLYADPKAASGRDGQPGPGHRQRPRAQVQLQHGPVRPGREVGGRHRHQLPGRQDPG